MAIHLHKSMDLALLTDIEREHPIEERALHAMKAWLDNDSQASWAKVVYALGVISKNVLALEMEGEHCGTVCVEAVPTPHPQLQEDTTPSPHSQLGRENEDSEPLLLSPQSSAAQAPELQSLHQPQPKDQATSDSTVSFRVAATSTASSVPSFDRSTTTVSQDSSESGSRSGGANVQAITEEATQLQEQFVTVLAHTKIHLMKKEAQSQSFLIEFKVILTSLPLSTRHQHLHFLKEEEPQIWEAMNTYKVFKILEPYWNYVDYALLEYLIKEFGTDELQQEMKRYIAQLERFEKKTSVKDFNLAVKDNRVLPAHFKTVTLPQSKDPAKCSLYEVRQLKNEVVNRSSLTGYTVYLQGVECSSVNITLAYPPEAHTELLEVLDEQFIVTHKIVRIRFDSVHRPALHYVEQSPKLWCQDIVEKGKRKDKAPAQEEGVSQQLSHGEPEEEATLLSRETTAEGRETIQQKEASPMFHEDGSRSGGVNVQAIVEEAAHLQEQFVTVFMHTRIYFMEKEGTSQRFLTGFKLTHETLPFSMRHQHLHFLKEENERIKNAADTDEIFDIIEPHLNYVDYAFLEYLIKEFGTEELQQEMKQYIAELELFEKKTSVQDFDLAVKDQRVLPDHFRTIVLHQSKDPAKCSLYKVRQIKDEIVDHSQ